MVLSLCKGALPNADSRNIRVTAWWFDCFVISTQLHTQSALLINWTNVILDMCSLPDPPRLEGLLKPNNHLHIAERLYEGQVLGPESIVFDHGGLYVYVFCYYCQL